MKNSLVRLLTVLFALGLFSLRGAAVEMSAAPSPRERLLFDFGWKFHLGNEWGIGQKLDKSGSGRGPASMAFSDASWRPVNLPHDWAIELPFDPRADASHGFRAVGEAFPENSVAWYRRTFELPASDKGRRLWIEVDGAFRDSSIFVNGWIVGHNDSGYGSARYDITDVARCGEKNVVAIQVDATHPEGWFYEGAGIYRHVWLVKTAPVALAPDSVFVYSAFPGNLPTGEATIHLQAQIDNKLKTAAEAEVSWEIFAPDGKSVASAKQSVNAVAGVASDVRQSTTVALPELWSPETPRLYHLTTTVSVAGKAVDQQMIEFGIRTVAFDANRGFLLNGQPYVIKGTCNHQDHAGVGSALPDRLQYFRIGKLKEMGSNAYRTSHNPPTPELLEACDRLGMLVMDENRLLGSDAQHLQWLEDLVRRDRNHPSVVIWSLANEEFNTQATPAGGRTAATMEEKVKMLDPTRQVTANSDLGNVFEGINSAVDVRGWSYHIGVTNMDAYHAAHPTQPNVGSEQGSTVSTRGIYYVDPVRGYVTAYDDNAQNWSNTAEQWWTFFDSRPWLSGGFVWTGFDYRGEPTPYGWPCVNSHFGVYDTCGFAKDNFWYYRAWWTKQPVLHLLPHWNWTGKEGQIIDVRALSNCDEVELFLNQKSLGRLTMKHDSELKWKVPYAPGTLFAKGFKDGKLVIETEVETTGAAAAVHLTPDRATIDADGEDISVITVSIMDAQGRVVPVANNAITFTLDGPGRIIGVGNGDPSCHEPDTFVADPVVVTQPIEGWKTKNVPVNYPETQPELSATFDDSTWSSANLSGNKNTLEANGEGFFRAKLAVTEADLKAPAIELWFGKIIGNATLYVNGVKVADASDGSSASIFEVKSLLHAGENSVAILARTWGPTGGISHGVAWRKISSPAPTQWSRSVFNGLAQIIVQSSKHTGELKLTASANGLKADTITLKTSSVTLPPSVP
ncbi:MAG TPA: beta-galactosidase GalA [Lacunisphaera sp.]|jgi:beta-galactosidase